VINTRPR